MEHILRNCVDKMSLLMLRHEYTPQIVFLSFSFTDILYDETKMGSYPWKSHEIGHTNHRHTKQLSCKFDILP